MKYNVFMSTLRKDFKGVKLALRKKGDKETITVDGDEIRIMWMPHARKLKDETALDILYRDCVKEIETLLNGEELSS